MRHVVPAYPRPAAPLEGAEGLVRLVDEDRLAGAQGGGLPAQGGAQGLGPREGLLHPGGGRVQPAPRLRPGLEPVEEDVQVRRVGEGLAAVEHHAEVVHVAQDLGDALEAVPVGCGAALELDAEVAQPLPADSGLQRLRCGGVGAIPRGRVGLSQGIAGADGVASLEAAGRTRRQDIPLRQVGLAQDIAGADGVAHLQPARRPRGQDIRRGRAGELGMDVSQLDPAQVAAQQFVVRQVQGPAEPVEEGALQEGGPVAGGHGAHAAVAAQGHGGLVGVAPDAVDRARHSRRGHGHVDGGARPGGQGPGSGRHEGIEPGRRQHVGGHPPGAAAVGGPQLQGEVKLVQPAPVDAGETHGTADRPAAHRERGLVKADRYHPYSARLPAAAVGAGSTRSISSRR